MPLFLRKIQKGRWRRDTGLSWLPEGSLPADPLADLNTQNNKLSVWHVEDDRSNLEQIVTALAANRDAVSNLDCMLIDQQILFSEMDVKVEDFAGDTKDAKANVWHRQLSEISAQKLVELARVIMQHAEKKRFSEHQVLALIKKATESGGIDMATLEPEVRAKI